MHKKEIDIHDMGSEVHGLGGEIPGGVKYTVHLLSVYVYIVVFINGPSFDMVVLP